MIVALTTLGCSDGKSVSTDTDPPAPAPPHSSWSNHTATHTGNTLTCDPIAAAASWSLSDDPCAVLEGKRFERTTCSTAWFSNGYLHLLAGGDPLHNVKYTCTANGTVAQLEACSVNEDGAFSFDLETGVLLVKGSDYTFVADDWQDHSGTTLGYWFFTGSGSYTPDWCK